MSEKKRKRGRPRTNPIIISYEAEMRMRNNIPRNIKKPKYLLDAEEESSHSRGSTPNRNTDERVSHTSSNKNSRGYNPEIDDKNSEFHYGSDFEQEQESENDSEIGSVSDITGLLSDDEGVISENEGREGCETPLGAGHVGMSPYFPEFVWLQDRSVPQLQLPPSADDLLIPLVYVMPAVGIYEVLRHFKTLVRLSPFRFEEFCGALVNQQQSVLLAEIHIALLRALIREDESQSTHFGPMDHKDSVNIMLYLVDSLTWPQLLYNYLQSDLRTYSTIVKMMDTCSYPYTSMQNRLQVLRALTDEVLSVSGVREELISEGKLRYDDHCRSCHKTGDLLCCDSCTAVYHLACLEGDVPPVPMDDWTCSVCVKNQLVGVTDCLSFTEASGMLCRHDPLGYDRHGRKYWFLVRRLIVESSSGSVWYYSSQQQVRCVLSLLDAGDLEQDLMASIDDQQPEMERQLQVTALLTEEKADGRESALCNNNKDIYKFLSKKKEEIMDEVKAEVKEEKDQDKTLDEKFTPGFASNDGVKQEVKEEGVDVKEEGDGTVKTSNTGDCGNKAVKSEAMFGIDSKQTKYDLWNCSIVGRPWMLSKEKVDMLVKEKLVQLNSATAGKKEYRLGCDCGQSYVNQFTSNTLALNKLQHNEDRDKKRHLVHKFSVGGTTEFKWSGTIHGSQQHMVECLRASLQQLEQQVSSHLYHPHWAAMRKTWLTTVSSSATPLQFVRSVVWLVAAIKPVVFNTVWHDALGHVRLCRVTALEREDKRRQEKRDKKELESQQLDEFRNTLPVRFTKIPKHQLWKVRGEEYRVVCGDGWRWWCRSRHPQPADARTQGLRAGPDKVMVGVHMAGGLRGLPVDQDVFERLAVKTPGLRSSIYSPNHCRKHGLEHAHDTVQKNEIIISNAAGESQTQKVEVVVTPLEEFFEDGLVNVSRSLVSRTRLVYPKVPLPSQLLDGLLARRIAMPRHQQQTGTNENGVVDVQGDGVSKTPGGNGAAEGVIQEIPDSQRSATHRLRPAGNLLKEIRQHKLRYESLDESVFQYQCYSPTCNSVGGGACYSALCLAKTRTREKLINAVTNYTIVTSKPSPYGEVGVNDVIMLSEMDFSEDNKKSVPKKPPATNFSNMFQSATKANSAGHVIGRSVELKDKSSGGVNNEISVRLEQDLDDNSQSSSVSLEDKFTSKEDKSSEGCKGRVSLKKLPVDPPKTKKTILRLPQVSTCRIGRDRYNILVLPKWELKVLSRRGWRHTVSGFHHLSKTNTSVWPYQCPRPLFRHTWLYKTATLTSLSAVALQLRLVWACLRWEDMQEKGASDGKKQITTETEIIQTEILKRKFAGRFSEKTEYLRRKVTIPFEMPKPMREFTPSQRSGLRKRHKVQTTQEKHPESVEEWIPEEMLQLWEIRLFGERLERAANQPKKTEGTTTSATALKITVSANTGPNDLKQRLEEQLKQQRAVYQQQQRDGRTMLKISSIVKPATILTPATKVQPKTATVTTAVTALGSPTKKIMRTKDGRIISVQTLGSIPTSSSLGNSSIFPMSSLPKIISPHTQNKVIRLQTVPANPSRMMLPRPPRPIAQATVPNSTAPATLRLPNQNIQIHRLPDGQIQVKGLLEGQQMIQRPDGEFQLINTAASLNKVAINATKTLVTGTATTVQVTQQKTLLVKPLQQQQIVKVNGQQLLIRKDGMGTQIVSVGAGEALKSTTMLATQQQQTPTVIPIGNSPQVKTIMSTDGTVVKTVVGSSQPAAAAASPVVTPIAAPKTEGSSLTLRVQVKMTEKGPKTIIQGLQPTVGLTKDHIRAIQQQVRSMLAQYNLKLDQVSPIMTLTLHIANQAQQQVQQSPQVVSAQSISSNQQKDATIFQSQQQIVKQIPGSPTKTLIQTPVVKLPTVIAIKNSTNISAPSTIIRASSGLINNSVNSVNTIGASGKDNHLINTTKPPNNQFVLTNDYIQQTIQSALNRNDLSPDVEEKLVQYKQYSTEQGTVPTVTAVTPSPPAAAAAPSSPLMSNKRPRDPSESCDGRGRKKPRNISGAGGAAEPSTARVGRVVGTPRHRSTDEGGAVQTKRSRRSGALAASPADDARRKQAQQAKLDGQLSKHKDLIKKSILNKRALLEKELQLQIHKELSIARQQLQAIKKDGSIPNKQELPAIKKRKQRDGMSEHPSSGRVPAPSSTVTVASTTAPPRPAVLQAKGAAPQQLKKLAITNKTVGNNKKGKRKNKKNVCICRTPFDDTKFYVGCDLCGNWFHGDCVGINEALSRTLTEYVCDDCANAKLSKELYCFCKQPYDESQFYICCEECNDWYHGRCVGIMQGEAEDIDDYVCPKCDPNNIWNHSCQKKLSSKDYTELKKAAKTLVAHKNAWPFLEAVDPGEVPDYHKVVSEPMDLRTVEQRVRDHYYSRLASFIGDVMLLLDNCRLYNSPDSSFVSCAATLESFFCSKVKLLKQKINSQSGYHSR